MPRNGLVPALAGGALILAAMSMTAAGTPVAAARAGGVTTSHAGPMSTPALPLEQDLVQAGSLAPTDAQCRAQTGRPCYSPQEMRHAYGVDQLIGRGGDGAGQTIVIFDSFGSPTITSDLANFDAAYGLPAPPSFTIASPLGTVPFDPSAIPDQISWAAETTLDVEWAHAMAPAASIVLMTSPVDETEGVQGLPEFNALENFALDHRLGQVWSQSWGATENTLFTTGGEQVYRQFESTYARAAARGVTVFASSGDNGTANLEQDLQTVFPFPTVNFPASSPLVTAVGGTSLTADTSGNYQSEVVWNEASAATGGGISQKFGEPLYQRLLPRSDQTLLNGNRGLPDIAFNADPRTPVLVFLSFLGASRTGFFRIGGTSEGSPALAGVVSDINTLVGHPVGLLNPFLYVLGAFGLGFHDVTTGNNGIDGIPGYDAMPGWDASTGFGTPDFGQLFGDIAFLARGHRHLSLRALESRAASLRRLRR